MKADTNGDGVIVLQEMLAHANEQTQRYAGSYRPEQSIPPSLDANVDGTVSRSEFKALIDRVFDATDTNRDGRLSPDERAALATKSSRLQQEEATARRAQQETEQARQRAASCGLPTIAKTAKLVLVSAYEGQALSTVSLDGDDEAVTVSRIIVEPGREPLALALTSHTANIWLIEGDTKRVSNVVVSALAGNAAKTPRAGVVGIPREKVVVAKSTDCLRQIPSQARNVPETEAGRFAVELGRKPDAIFAVYDMPTIALPSGTVDKKTPLPGSVAAPANGPAADVWNVMLDFNPKGLVEIDPAKVVAATKPARYAVRPQEAGLAQLVQSGALEVSRSARVVKLGGTQIQLGDGDDLIRGSAEQSPETRMMPVQYTIKSQISIPAGLSGAHSVKFVLPAGVPEPKGELGHSQLQRIGR